MVKTKSQSSVNDNEETTVNAPESIPPEEFKQIIKNSLFPKGPDCPTARVLLAEVRKSELGPVETNGNRKHSSNQTAELTPGPSVSEMMYADCAWDRDFWAYDLAYGSGGSIARYIERRFSRGREGNVAR